MAAAAATAAAAAAAEGLANQDNAKQANDKRVQVDNTSAVADKVTPDVKKTAVNDGQRSRRVCRRVDKVRRRVARGDATKINIGGRLQIERDATELF